MALPFELRTPIPTTEPDRLRPAARRTAVLRAVLALALVGVLGSLALRMDARPAPTIGVRRTIAAGVTHLVRHRPIAVVTLSGTLSQIGGGAAGVAAIALEVDELQDHGRPTFVIEGGVRWRWVDADAERADAAVRAELLELAES